MLVVLDLLARLVGAPSGAQLGALPGAGLPLSTALVVSLVGAATFVALAAAVHVALVRSTIAVAHRRPAHRDDTGEGVPIAQNDPDADGHVRPRAPGGAASAVRSAAFAIV